MAGQAVQLLGVAQACTRLGVLERVMARPKPKAGDIVCVLGAAQGVVYRERPANDRLEAFCKAFERPWQCRDLNPARTDPERGFAWTGSRVRSQAEALKATCQRLPSKMALAGGYWLTQSLRTHLVKRTRKHAWLRGCCWRQVPLSDLAVHQTSRGTRRRCRSSGGSTI